MKNKLATLVGALALSAAASAQTWIWYPGDYEIWLGNRMNNRRTERGAFFPPFWKTDSHYVVVEFSKKLDLAEPEEIFIAAEGKYNVKLDGKLQFGMPSTLKLPAGKHSLNIKVWNQSTPPTIYVKGKTVNTDKTWKVTYEDKEWIDESGKASDTSATVYMDAGCWNFDGATQLPSKFSLARKPMKAVSSTPRKEGVLYDFGKETFGYITLKEVKGKGTIHIYYGESPEEALDTEYCETLDKLLAEPGQITDLAIHRIMTDLLKGTEKETMILRYTDFAERASKQSSEREVIAMQIERKAEDCYKAEYARRHLGECYEGTVSGVTQRGLFIELDNGVEGFVPASSLTPSGTSLTEGVRLTDPASGKTWSLGDKMMITIVRADVNLGKIDFEVAPAAKA